MDEVNKYSQRGEELEIARIFKVLGIEKGYLVDLGAGDGYTLSNTRRLLENGWTGDLYDGDPRGAKDVIKLWIDVHSVHAKIPDKVDFISIDLDGNDYYVLQSILLSGRVCPSLIVAEYNPIFERNEAKVMPYNEAHVWQNNTYYGGSLAAFEKLGKEFGYTLIQTHGEINAFFLRNDQLEAHPELQQPIHYVKKWGHKAHDPKLPWITLT